MDRHMQWGRRRRADGSSPLPSSADEPTGQDIRDIPVQHSLFGSPGSSQQASWDFASSPMQSTHDTSVHDHEVHAAESSRAAMRNALYENEVLTTVDRRRLPEVEKDADDPSNPPAAHAPHEWQTSNTVTTLSRLLASRTSISPDVSRAPSYINPAQQYARNTLSRETAALPDHLYTRGLLEGRHSDITVRAFGTDYKLHRIILDRAPFFATALSEPWLEANSRDMVVRPEEIDSNITQRSFDLALKRLYRGLADPVEEDSHAVGLFATGCWLELPDLIEASIESILRQMSPDNLAPTIILVTKNYYGRAGEKILASAKAMLCRDGWRMPIRYWDGIPGDIVREIVGGDGFFVDGEWERWVLAKRLLDRRLKASAKAAGLVDPRDNKRLISMPETRNLAAIRFDGVSRRSTPLALTRGMPNELAKYVGLYTHPSIEPLLVLLDEGIHYIHLNFEQLQYVRSAKDIAGIPVMPEKVVSNALWQGIELRQRVVNARDQDLELGLAIRAPTATNESSQSSTSPKVEGKGKARAGPEGSESSSTGAPDVELDSGSWDGNGKPRKFWIPSSDCNVVMGGNADPVIAVPNSGTVMQPRHASRLSTTVQPEDVQWASDFAFSTTAGRPGTSDGSTMQDVTTPPPAVSYTHLPPFRFSAEFPSPRLLKEKKRVYSRTVFYAGSLWNIYIQKVASARSTKQLGVYLHRAKERDTEEAVFGPNVASMQHGNVEGRIGLLEREMRDPVRRRRRDATDELFRQTWDDGESSASAPDAEGAPSSSRNTGRTREKLNGPPKLRTRKSGQTTAQATTASPPTSGEYGYMPSSELDTDFSTDDAEASLSRLSNVSALPSYVDMRPTIRTYFKIYSPSRGGRMLSVYESAPDKFNFSQSWGWKSSTLMLDEGLLSQEEGDQQIGILEATTGRDGGRDDAGPDGPLGSPISTIKEEGSTRRSFKSIGDGKLRFMVVIGNI